MTCVSTVLLVYVAIVVQVEVGFFWHEHLCATENNALTRFDPVYCNNVCCACSVFNHDIESCRCTRLLLRIPGI